MRVPLFNPGYNVEWKDQRSSSDVPCVLAVAGDPGGAAALAPVLVALQGHFRVRVEARPYRQAREVWRRWGVQYQALDEGYSSRCVFELLENLAPSLLLCGTSINGVDLEKSFVAAARRCRVPSLGLLDFWSNYAARFSDERGNLSCLPDLVSVMDSQAREQMIAAGFPAARLCVTGQPAFDHLEAQRHEFNEARRAALRTSLGAGSHDQLVVFVSQPLAAMYGPGSSCASHHPGYNEHEVLRLVVSTLERISEETTAKVVLNVRLHPRESAEDFRDLASDRIRIRLACEADAHELVLSADLVTGMSSALLVEACYLGCITLSLQPGLRTSDVLPTNALGVTRAVYHSDEALPAFREVMLSPITRQAMQQRLARFQTDGHATERVLNHVFELMGQPVTTLQS